MGLVSVSFLGGLSKALSGWGSLLLGGGSSPPPWASRLIHPLHPHTHTLSISRATAATGRRCYEEAAILEASLTSPAVWAHGRH